MKRILLTIATVAFAIAPAQLARGATDTGTSALDVTVVAEASFSAAFTSTTLTASNTKFGGYSGTSNFTYKIRTTQSTGTGSITVQVTTFGVNGPAVADLSYTCAASASGTPCSGSVAASSASATTVISFGADAHSSDTGDSSSATWTLVDKPGVKTGSYTSTATFTISAT